MHKQAHFMCNLKLHAQKLTSFVIFHMDLNFAVSNFCVATSLSYMVH